MKYIGLDVHMKTTLLYRLDETGKIAERDNTPTTPAELTKLVQALGDPAKLLFAQEAGKMSYLVHDVHSAKRARILTFNAYHLKRIASSTKKGDKRASYWLA